MLYGKYRKLVGKQEEGINAEKFLCVYIDFCTNCDKKYVPYGIDEICGAN